MKKRFTRWIVMMMSIIMVLSTPIGVLAETNDEGKASNIQDAYMTGSMGMFVNNATAQVRRNSDESMEAVITYLRDTNTYPKVFLGTVEEANTADASGDTSKVYEAVQVAGGYQYIFPLEKLDTEFALSLYSASKNSWRENTLTITLKDQTTEDGNGDNGSSGDTDSDNDQGDNESGTKLIDGIYVGVGSVPGGKYPTNGYDVSAAVEIKDGKIASVKYTDALENDGNISYKKWVMNGYYSYDEESKIWSYIKGIAEQLLGKSDTTEYDTISGATKTTNALVAAVDQALEKAQTGETTSVDIPGEEEDNNVALRADKGIYSVDVVCNGLTVIDAELTSKNGTMTALITLNGKGYDILYFGTEEEAYKAGEERLIQSCATKQYVNASGATKEGYQFEIPVESLDKDIKFISHAKSSNNWFYRTIRFNSSSLVKIGEPEDDGIDIPGTDTPGTGTPDTNVPSDTTVILPNGTYSVSVETGAPMFKVTDCKLVVKNKTINAILTLSGTGYDYLYQGTVEEAKKAGQSSWSRYQISTDGKYKYVISIPYDSFVKNQMIAVAARSARNTTWFDRSLDFDLSSLAVVSASTEIDGSLSSVGSIGSTGTPGSGTGSSSGKTDNTLSSTEINNKLNTVDKNTTVQDGTYVPEFGFTGGSGRATISCSKVVVKNGNATATIVFTSPNFTWVKSLGTTVYNENKGGNSTFTIPVNLNGETKISAETTAMSQPYTVEYMIYCFIDGTKVTMSNVGVNKSKDVIELEGADTKEKDTEALEEENTWGSFYDEVETTGADAEDLVQNSNTAVIVLSIILLLVCVYAIVVTVFMVKKIRRMRGE